MGNFILIPKEISPTNLPEAWKKRNLAYLFIMNPPNPPRPLFKTTIKYAISY